MKYQNNNKTPQQILNNEVNHDKYKSFLMVSKYLIIPVALIYGIGHIVSATKKNTYKNNLNKIERYEQPRQNIHKNNLENTIKLFQNNNN